jgi:hypothetical protein
MQNKASESGQFFAWARSVDVPGVRIDHTWVTTYDNRAKLFTDIDAVVANGESYWYAWGYFHPQGGNARKS